MHIWANMRPKICIKGRLIISSKFFTFLEEGGGSRLMMTKCDMGVGRSKFLILWVTYFLHGPLLSKRISWKNIQNSQTCGQNTLKIVNVCLLLVKKRLRKNYLVPWPTHASSSQFCDRNREFWCLTRTLLMIISIIHQIL